MIDFIELNEPQKRYVLEVMNRFLHYDEEITISQMKEYHTKMVEARDQGCPKIGYPNWLIKPENKLSKSVYFFPVPTEDEIEDFYDGNTEAVIVLEKLSPMTQKVIQQYGLL